MSEIGYASLAIIPSFKGFGSALEKGSAPALTGAGQEGGKHYAAGMASSVKSRARSIFAPLLAAGAAFKAGQFLKDSVGEASDLNESLNAVRVSYGKNAKAVKALGRDAAESLGLSNTEFNSLSVRFSAFSKTIAGSNGKKVVSTLDDLTTRASDFASVMNLDVSDAAQLFQSGLAGETEPLRQFGIDMSAAKVEAYALSEGIVKSKADLDEAAKVQARYGLLMQQTAQTQGDFSNTSDQLANSQRILNARWDNAKAKFGTALLPAMQEGSRWLNREGIPAFEKFSDWFVDDGLPAIQDFADDMKPLAEAILPAAGDALKTIASAVKKAAPYATDTVEAFNGLPDWLRGGIAGTGLAALLAFKGIKFTGLGKGGSLFSKASPVPVIVMNKGFGPGGGVPVPGGGAGGGGFWKGLGAFIKGGATPAAAAVVTGYMEKWFESGFKPGKGKTGVADKAGQIIDNIQLGKAAGWSDKIGSVVPFLDTAGEAARKGVEEADKALADLVNSGNAKSAREQFQALKDEAIKQGVAIDDLKAKFPKYAAALKQVPETHVTEFLLPNFFEQYGRILKYGKYLEDLDGKTVTTFLKSVRTNNDIGESGDPRFARANGGTVERGKAYTVGERGPERFVPNMPGRIVPNHELSSGGGVSVYVGQVVAHDYNDFMSQAQMRARRAALDGRRPA